MRLHTSAEVADLTLAERSTIHDTLAVLGREDQSEAALEIIAVRARVKHRVERLAG